MNLERRSPYEKSTITFSYLFVRLRMPANELTHGRLI